MSGASLEVRVRLPRNLRPQELERLVPPRLMSLEQAMEFCREDECVEVTPDAVRIRKVELDQVTRARNRSRQRASD